MEWLFCKALKDPEAIEQAEKAFNVVFPSDFKAHVLTYNGGRPRPNCFDLGHAKELAVKTLLSFNKDDVETIYGAYQGLLRETSQPVVPFMSDPAGNYICFAFQGESDPAVVFWDHEQAGSERDLTFICESFTAFVNRLYAID
ncbi:SMI1/KNR4 family protein [Paenibacillus oryzisoli]|uniref:SMI1/KNR4 family protein n=1 Tax=Paenibacillus oryzisoli TaxID=1850517 RepID=UPI003D26ACC3